MDKKVLIVDDMQEVYDKLRGYFPNSDYSQTAKEAFERIEDLNYDVVYTDVDLEGKNKGLEIAKKATSKGIETIVMSRENYEKEAKNLGARFVFKKELIENGPKQISTA